MPFEEAVYTVTIQHLRHPLLSPSSLHLPLIPCLCHQLLQAM